jgi:quercetin dioxygenase-like cupin family protein
MRVVTTGTNDGGRSYVASVVERVGPPGSEDLHEIFDGSLTVEPREGRSGDYMEIAPGAGGAMWRVFDFAPGVLFDTHYTRSIDFDVVVEGTITLGLDEEDVELAAGDCVLIQGDSHSWKAGDAGCRMLIALLGLKA